MKRDRQTEQEKEQEKEEESYTAPVPGESVVLSAIRERMEEEQEEKRSWRRWLVGTGSLAAAVLLLFRVFFGLAVVEGSSMYPQYHEGDLVLFQRMFVSPARGDVVLVEAPDGRTLIKRVAGLPGEEVYIDGQTGTVYIDGEELSEEYGPTEPEEYLSYPVRLGEGEYFVLGDNRGNSMDSRYYGPIGESQIRGEVRITLRMDERM